MIFSSDEKFNPKQKSAILADFIDALEETAEKLLPEQVSLFQRKMILDLFRRIVLKTPVDTGRARGNWQLSINQSPDTELIGPFAPNLNPLNNISQVLESITPFSICYITNNVPYIVYLVEGSSKQAPQGMVALSVHEMLSIFR